MLVLDNVDDITVVNGYLPDINKGGHILITSRDPNTTGIPAQGLEVGLLLEDDAADLLLLRTNLPVDDNEFRSEALKVVTELGFLALAVEQAAAYIREYLKDIFKFMEVYSTYRTEILKQRPSGNWEYPREVATTWLLSFKQVKDINVDAAHLLQLLAFLNPDGILIEFLDAGKEGLSDSLNKLISDPFAFSKASGELERFSLIRRAEYGQIISIHRLVQSVIKDALTEDDRIDTTEMVVKFFLAAFPEFEPDKRQLCRLFQDQIVGPSMALDVETVDVTNVWHRVGLFLLQDGKYHDGGRFFLKELEMLTKLADAENRFQLDAMQCLAIIYRLRGQFNDAAELIEKTVRLRENFFGAEHVDTLSSKYELAIVYSQLGRKPEALSLLENVLKVRQRLLGPDHLHTLDTTTALALLYLDLGQSQTAIEIQEGIVNAGHRILGAEHPDTLIYTYNLAICYEMMEQLERAEELYKLCLERMKRILGPDHPDTLNTSGSLALVYHKLGRSKEAMERFETVLKKCQTIFGMQDYLTLGTMKSLLYVYRDMDRFEEAEILEAQLSKLEGNN